MLLQMLLGEKKVTDAIGENSTFFCVEKLTNTSVGKTKVPILQLFGCGQPLAQLPGLFYSVTA